MDAASDITIKEWGRGWLYLDGVKVLATWCWPESTCEPPPGTGPVYELVADDPHERIVRLWRATVTLGQQ